MPVFTKSSYSRPNQINPKTGKTIRKNPEKFEQLFVNIEEETTPVDPLPKDDSHEVALSFNSSLVDDSFDKLCDTDCYQLEGQKLSGKFSSDSSLTNTEGSSFFSSPKMFTEKFDRSHHKERRNQGTLNKGIPEVSSGSFKSPAANSCMTGNSSVFEDADIFTLNENSGIASLELLGAGKSIISSTPLHCDERKKFLKFDDRPNKLDLNSRGCISLPIEETSLKLGNDAKNIVNPEVLVLSEIGDSMGDLSHGFVCKAGKGWKRFMRRTLHKNHERLSQSMIDTNVKDCHISRHSLSILQYESVCDVSIPSDSKALVMNLCEQQDFIEMSKYFAECTKKRIKKIGEGAYGEVFMVPANSPRTLASVLKIMPIEGDFNVNEEPQKTFADILSELVVSRELSKLRSEGSSNTCSTFAFLKKCQCLQGTYTKELLELWDHYDEVKCSENDRPDIFPPTQLFLILEYEFAGQDLENYVLPNAMNGVSVFVQVAYSLAVAEQQVQFEHRDLHWGNILVTETSEKTIPFNLGGKSIDVPSQGTKVTIIDFTMSRLQTAQGVYFDDLSQDPTLFNSDGDYQFEIYRKMRNENGNEWKTFCPKTNIFWLHYLVRKLIEECRYRNQRSKKHVKALEHLQEIEKKILSYESTEAFLTAYNMLS